MNCNKKELLLYAVTDRSWLNGRTLYDQVEEALKGGATFIQLREKTLDTDSFRKEAAEIKELCARYHVPFVINDNVEIAKEINADGVHVGQEDMKPSDVRKLLGENKIIGLSTHSEEQGMAAYNDIDVDYIGVGPIFPTTTKDTAPVGLGYLEFAVKNLHLPFIAIGGIKDYNIDEIIKRGAKRICLVSDIVGAEDICKKIIDLNNKILKK